jgi:hypothetical protein
MIDNPMRNSAANPHFSSVLIKLLPDSKPALDSWRTDMNARLDEARESIRGEGVDYEMWFGLKSSQHHFLIGLMATGAVAGLPPATNHPIDEVHSAFKRAAWDRSVRFPSSEVASVNGLVDIRRAHCAMRCFMLAGDQAERAEELIRSALLTEGRGRSEVTHAVFRHETGTDLILSWLVMGSEELILAARELQGSFLQACEVVRECQAPEALLDVRAGQMPQMLEAGL